MQSRVECRIRESIESAISIIMGRVSYVVPGLNHDRYSDRYSDFANSIEISQKR